MEGPAGPRNRKEWKGVGSLTLAFPFDSERLAAYSIAIDQKEVREQLRTYSDSTCKQAILKKEEVLARFKISKMDWPTRKLTQNKGFTTKRNKH